MGAFGAPGGPGGPGGKISISGSGILTFRDIDLITGADIETVRADIFLSDDQQHSYFAATGSLGGKGTSAGSTGSDGGAGGVAGSINVTAQKLYPAPAFQNTLTFIVGYGKPGGQMIPRITDQFLSPGFEIGETRQIFAADGSKLYRLRLDTSGNALAGGSGGIPGGRPFGQFPGRFGSQGASGALTGLFPN